MIFYQDSNGEWYATQADAKASKFSFQQVDVPTDKYGLLSWLRHYRSQMMAGYAGLQEKVDLVEEAKAIVGPSASLVCSLQEHIDWLLDQAKPAEVEAVFAALGTRFHEMRKTQP